MKPSRQPQSPQPQPTSGNDPKSVEVERSFICRTFLVRGAKRISETFVEAKSLSANPDWFSDPVCRLVWMAAEQCFSEPEFTSLTLYRLVKRANAIAKASKNPEINSVSVSADAIEEFSRRISAEEPIAAYASELREAALVRSVRSLMADVSSELANGSGAKFAVSRLIAGAQAALSDGMATSHRLSVSQLCDKALADYDEAYHQIVELGNYEWTPGLQLFCRKLSYVLNGFTPNVTILAARPGVGKTSCAMNFSRFWLDHGYKVGFVSVDMSPDGFVKRQISEMTRISSRKLQFAKSDNYAEDRKKVVAEIEKLKELEKSGNFMLFDEYDVDSIKATVTILKDQGKIDVLVIDYLQLLTFRGCERVSSVSKVTYISNVIHSIANTCQIPVLCLSQLNRDNTKDGGREPQLSDLRDSGAIEQDAANVILLHRNQQLLDKWKGNEPPLQFAYEARPNTVASYCPMWMIVAKARDGDAGTKLPFVVVQNKYAWYLGDYEADGEDKFARVYDDWRHDGIEKVWERNGSLIKMADVRAIEIANKNAERARKGLPPLGVPSAEKVVPPSGGDSLPPPEAAAVSVPAVPPSPHADGFPSRPRNGEMQNPPDAADMSLDELISQQDVVS